MKHRCQVFLQQPPHQVKPRDRVTQWPAKIEKKQKKHHHQLLTFFCCLFLLHMHIMYTTWIHDSFSSSLLSSRRQFGEVDLLYAFMLIRVRLFLLFDFLIFWSVYSKFFQVISSSLLVLAIRVPQWLLEDCCCYSLYSFLPLLFCFLKKIF